MLSRSQLHSPHGRRPEVSKKTNNQAGKGDLPRPVNLTIYQENYDSIFRKESWPNDQEPFESEDHDNDIKQYP